MKPKWRCVRCNKQSPYVTRYCNSPWCQLCKGKLDAKGTLICGICHVERPRAEFLISAGVSGRCLACRRERSRLNQRKSYARHRERRMANSRAWYRNNRDYAIARAKKRYARKKLRIWRKRNVG